MKRLERFSEPYNATGGLAAVGVLNQLGRPDITPLEVLVREAIQNCWDAKRADVSRIQVEIGWSNLDAGRVNTLRNSILVDPPPGLGLDTALRDGMQTLYIADFGTHGLGGPTRADHQGDLRDFVDFVRNIGQPPDKDFGGGSFGYGKAAFYIASEARTIIVDTLCPLPDGSLERRLLGCALGDNFELDGVPYTGRHWWGRVVDGIPEPLVGDEAQAVATELGLPSRNGRDGLGTTVLVIAPCIGLEASDGTDCSMEFVAEAVVWNFWPRMIDTPGGARRSIDVRLTKDGVAMRLPNPRTHPRLRGFVEAMDRMHQEPGEDDEFTLDRAIKCLRPVQHLGRLTIQKGATAPADPADRPVPRGASITAAGVHHVALMRTPEIVVKYLAGPPSASGKLGYSGVFKCALDVDNAFKSAEPPTHDDWIFRFVHDPHQRSFVKVALDRIAGICRIAAGYEVSIQALTDVDGVPLGEFADAMASLMPGTEGPGARRQATKRGKTSPKRRRKAPGRTAIDAANADVWVDGGGSGTNQPNAERSSERSDEPALTSRPRRAPQARPAGDPSPAIASDGSPVMRYPFELRAHGSRIRLSGSIEIMTNDGSQQEMEPPAGYITPRILRWIDPTGVEHEGDIAVAGPDEIDGRWSVEVELSEEMMRVDIAPEIA